MRQQDRPFLSIVITPNFSPRPEGILIVVEPPMPELKQMVP